MNRREFLKAASVSATIATLPTLPALRAPSCQILPCLVFAIDPAREKDYSMIVAWKVLDGKVKFIYADEFYAEPVA